MANLLILGDSISEEPYRSAGSAVGWTARFRDLCRSPELRGNVGGGVLDYDIDVLSLSGLSYLTMLSRAQQRLAVKRPDWTIVLLGTNDLTGAPAPANLAAFLARAEAVWNAVSSVGSALAVCTVPPIGFGGAIELMRLGFNDLVLHGSSGADVRTSKIDVTIDENLLVAQALAPSLWRSGLGEDPLHPNARGSRVLGDAIWAGFHGVVPVWIEEG